MTVSNSFDCETYEVYLSHCHLSASASLIQMVMEFPHTVLHFDSHQTNSSQIKLFIEVRLLCKNVAKPGSAM